MSPSSSSTSSSERIAPRLRETLRVALGFVLAMMLLDAATGWAWRAPSDPHVAPTALQRYFEYGRSIEGKLRGAIGRDDARTASAVQSGWLAHPQIAGAAAPSAPDKLLVAGYGQSFMLHVLRAAAQQDPRLELRLTGGPGAPLSHSFKLYQQDRRAHSAPVVVISVLASTLPQLVTMTTMTWAFESPAPFTYPRYSLIERQLREVDPIIDSLDGLRAALAQPARWQTLRDQLERYDEAFDPLVFDAGALDHSVLGRMTKRALGQRNQRRFTNRFVDGSGFTNRAGILDLAIALLADFAESARADGRLPIVLLIADRGYDDYLDRALAPGLTAHGIAFVSSHEIAPANDSRSFLADGHFRPDLDQRLGTAFLDTLHIAFAGRPYN
jgi:hypothetical protein